MPRRDRKRERLRERKRERGKGRVKRGEEDIKRELRILQTEGQTNRHGQPKSNVTTSTLN